MILHQVSDFSILEAYLSKKKWMKWGIDFYVNEPEKKVLCARNEVKILWPRVELATENFLCTLERQ